MTKPDMSKIRHEAGKLMRKSSTLNSYVSEAGWFGAHPTSPIYTDVTRDRIDEIIEIAEELKNLIGR